MPGHESVDGPAVAALVMQHIRDKAEIHIDVVGVGSSPYDHLRNAGVDVEGMSAAQATKQRDRTGKLKFKNKRSLWWWRMREALDPVHGSSLSLPQDRKLLADLTAPRWRLNQGGIIQVEPKVDIVKRLGRSPDRGDAAVMALPTLRVAGISNYTQESEPADWMSV